MAPRAIEKGRRGGELSEEELTALFSETRPEVIEDMRVAADELRAELAGETATFVVNREAARHLRNDGAIVNLSSSAEGSSLRTHGLYAATKAITDVLTRALALELHERNITVNAVSLEVGRPCAPNRVADVIAYLLSDHGHRLTGQVLRVGDPGLQL